MDPQTDDRVVYVNADLAFVTQMIKIYVVRQLEQLYGGLYNNRNVVLASTHTHGYALLPSGAASWTPCRLTAPARKRRPGSLVPSGPGGYSGYTLMQVTSFGFVEDNFWAIVNGTVRSIQLAHNDVQYAPAPRSHPG